MLNVTIIQLPFDYWTKREVQRHLKSERLVLILEPIQNRNQFTIGHVKATVLLSQTFSSSVYKQVQ